MVKKFSKFWFEKVLGKIFVKIATGRWRGKFFVPFVFLRSILIPLSHQKKVMLYTSVLSQEYSLASKHTFFYLNLFCANLSHEQNTALLIIYYSWINNSVSQWLIVCKFGNFLTKVSELNQQEQYNIITKKIWLWKKILLDIFCQIAYQINNTFDCAEGLSKFPFLFCQSMPT